MPQVPESENSSKQYCFWVVEDDELQMDTLDRLLKHKFCSPHVVRIETEFGFRQHVDHAKSPKPDLIICDVALPWSYPSDQAIESAPEEATGEYAFMEAGTRNWRYLRGNSIREVAQTPWIYYSILTKPDIGYAHNKDRNTRFLAKDRPVAKLLDLVEEFLEVDRHWNDSDETETNKLVNHPKVYESLLIGLRTPLDACYESLN